MKQLNRRRDLTEAEDLSEGNFLQTSEVRSWRRNHEKSSSTSNLCFQNDYNTVEERRPKTESKTSDFMQTDGEIASSETYRRNSV